MNIKDRFMVVVTIEPPGVKVVRGVYDHLTNECITELEAERICYEEYGEHLNKKTAYITKTIEVILAEMEYYNETCEKGFEITKQDIINNFKNDK